MSRNKDSCSGSCKGVRPMTACVMADVISPWHPVLVSSLFYPFWYMSFTPISVSTCLCDLEPYVQSLRDASVIAMADATCA